MGLSTGRVVSEQDFREISSVQLVDIGARQETADGRIYRYARAGGVTLAPGKLTVTATVDSNLTNVFVARTEVAGVNEVVIDAGGAVVAEAYKNGYLNINDATGEGVLYAVRNHSVLSGSGELTVGLVDPLVTALTVDASQATLTQNPYADIVISAIDQADMAVGVPNVSITNAYFGWVQTGGMCSVLADETLIIGKDVTIGTGVAGAVEMADLVSEQVVGNAIIAGVDTEYPAVDLTIDR